MIQRPELVNTPVYDYFKENHEEILQYFDAKVKYSDRFIDNNGNVSIKPELGHWGISWKYGTIAFMSLHSEEKDKTKARVASAIFIHLWKEGIEAGLAKKLAEGYINLYQV